MSTPTEARPALSFDRFASAVILGAALVAACLRPIQSDVFWDLRAGGTFWHTGHILTRETWTSTARGRYWPNHEWVWQALAYPLHLVGGLPLLVLLNALMATVALWLSRRLAPPGSRIGLVLLVAAVPAAAGEWALRPQVASLLLFALTLTWLVQDKVLRLPFVLLLWANVHAGVAMGGAAIALAALLALGRWLVSRAEDDRVRLRRLALVTAAGALATLVNPLGIGLWTYVVQARSNAAYRDLPDWVSAFHVDSSTVVFWLWFLGWLAAVTWRRRRFDSWPAQLLLVVALVTGVLTMVALRNIGFFTLAALPSAVIALAPDTAPHRDRVPHARPVLAALAVLGALLVAVTWAAKPARLEWYPISPAAVDAVRACGGPLYNTVALGGPLAWHAPDVVTFIDSRSDPFPDTLMHADRVLETSGDHRPLFDRYGIRCAVVPRLSVVAASLVRAGWQTAYVDRSVRVLTEPRARA